GCVPNERPGLSGGRDAGPAEAANERPSRSDRHASARRKSSEAATPHALLAADTNGKSVRAPLLRREFTDAFERTKLGPDWNVTGANWHIDAGRLCVRGARNHPLWLERRLPKNARVEFDAVSSSPEGDIKVELWGDGASSATSSSYTDATSYLVIF